MMDTERGGVGEHQLDSTQIFAGPNDGLSQTCNGVSTFVGLPGHSQKAGYLVIFPTLDMGRYVEIAEADILETEELSPARPPCAALGGTRVPAKRVTAFRHSWACRATVKKPAISSSFRLLIWAAMSRLRKRTSWRQRSCRPLARLLARSAGHGSRCGKLRGS